MIPGPQAQTLDLDRAIDHVAQRMTHVEDDAALAARIVSALPERRRSSWWMLGPAFAAVAMIVSGIVVLNRTSNTIAPLAGSQFAPASALAAAVRLANPAPNRTMPLEHLEHLEPLEPMVEKRDHEFSLPSLASVEPLSMQSVAPATLPDEAPLMVAPLSIEPLMLDPVQH